MKFRILRFKKLRSTNDTAIRMVKSSNLNYGMIIADSQSNGRGQYGRKWISFKGNLFVSFFYNLENMDLTMTKITKLNCILVKKLISKYYKKRIVYKKPNDLLIEEFFFKVPAIGFVMIIFLFLSINVSGEQLTIE